MGARGAPDGPARAMENVRQLAQVPAAARGAPGVCAVLGGICRNCLEPVLSRNHRSSGAPAVLDQYQSAHSAQGGAADGVADSTAAGLLGGPGLDAVGCHRSYRVPIDDLAAQSLG